MAEDAPDDEHVEVHGDRRVTGGRGDGDTDDGHGPDDPRDAAVVDEATGDFDPPEPLLDVLEDPAAGRNRLPYLLGLLDEDDPRERLAATTAVCLVVESDPELLDYAVGRLVDRLDDDAPVEVAHALDYLAARRPRAVDGAVTDLDDAAQRRARERMYRTGAGFARSEYLDPSVGDRPVGRTRVAGDAAADDPRRTYTDDGDESDDGGRATGEDGHERATGGTDAPDGDGDITSGTLQVVSRRLSELIERSRFDDLSVLTERRRGRHGDVYRTAGSIDGDRQAVALTVYRLPDDRRAFVGGFGSAMSDWADVDDHESVLSVYDWDVRPRPWAAVDYADATLATREDDPADPMWTVLELVEAVGYAHQHGVVHGAVDPGNVAYRDDVLTEGERQRPLLANVGLATHTGTASPDQGVDPRYAAPEHYDDRFGRVDHATDVYGLGVVLYRLVTGEHPYDGDADAVRERVTAAGTPAPTDVDDDLPAQLDKVVRKATATEKLRRYETVTNLARELRSIDGG